MLIDQGASFDEKNLRNFLGLNKSTKPPPKEWTVQVGSFATKEDAQNLANQLVRDGYIPFVKSE